MLPLTKTPIQPSLSTIIVADVEAPRMRLAILAFAVGLSGCYQPDQSALQTAIHNRIAIGMSIAQAVATLQNDGFDCSERDPVTCARIRQRLLPSSCIERVNLYSKGNPGVVTKIDVRPIACAGL